MKIIVYCYCHPLLETAPEPALWGSEVDHIYLDWGGRDQWQKLLQDSQQQRPSWVLVRKLEELGASLTEIGDRLAQLEGLGSRVVVLEQDYEPNQLNTIAGRQRWLQVLATVAQQQRRQGQSLGHARNRLQGLPPPGRAPYGYRKSKERYVLDRSTAPLIKTFCEQFLRLGSLRGAVRYLEQNYGKKISLTTAQRWLTHPVYRGDLLYQNQYVIPNTHNPILSREEAAQIDRLLGQNARLPPRSASAPHSLAGLVRCGICSSRWLVNRVQCHRGRQSYLYLRPQSCGQTPKCSALAYGQVLEATIQTICEQLPLTVARLSLPSVNDLKNQLEAAIDQKQTLLAQLPTFLEQGVLDQHTHSWRSYQLQQDIAQLRQQLDQLPPGDLQRLISSFTLPQFWWDLSETERRFYLREFVQNIVLRRQPEDFSLQVCFSFMPPTLQTTVYPQVSTPPLNPSSQGGEPEIFFPSPYQGEG